MQYNWRNAPTIDCISQALLAAGSCVRGRVTRSDQVAELGGNRLLLSTLHAVSTLDANGGTVVSVSSRALHSQTPRGTLKASLHNHQRPIRRKILFFSGGNAWKRGKTCTCCMFARHGKVAITYHQLTCVTCPKKGNISCRRYLSFFIELSTLAMQKLTSTVIRHPFYPSCCKQAGTGYPGMGDKTSADCRSPRISLSGRETRI